jgi:hypothetical protein
VANADPLTVTWTVFPTNLLVAFPSGIPGLLDDGEDDEPLQAENSVASVAQDATWQAPSQKRRREMGVSVLDIALILVGSRTSGGKIEAALKLAGFWISENLTVPADYDLGVSVVIS